MNREPAALDSKNKQRRNVSNGDNICLCQLCPFTATTNWQPTQKYQTALNNITILTREDSLVVNLSPLLIKSIHYFYMHTCKAMLNQTPTNRSPRNHKKLITNPPLETRNHQYPTPPLKLGRIEKDCPSLKMQNNHQHQGI